MPVPVSAPSFQSVTQPIEQRYRQYAQKAAQWTKQYEARGGKVYCGAGCFHCCDMPIRLSLAEALIVAQALDPAAATRVAAHAHKVQANARSAPDEESYVERHRQEVGFCPLLDRASGSCTQYAARPTRCRDTFSAFPARYCAAGAWEQMTPHERRDYQREVARTPGTDGEVHFIAPLEHLSEPVWITASKSMRQHWRMEVWGDFWNLTTLAADPQFMQAVERGQGRAAWQRASTLNLSHPVTLEIEEV
ncbi:YkgJ family cysteine cluster protein [Deinococcus sp.]|uniref:YkgJ family cysteine cluster protein n=1 Tax=Deinococcus sp. TaxID=47478 RepID=UPI0025B7DC1E|nr:YkgJ family cysteine cluster protein [Deinococcus sp.]